MPSTSNKIPYLKGSNTKPILVFVIANLILLLVLLFPAELLNLWEDRGGNIEDILNFLKKAGVLGTINAGAVLVVRTLSDAISRAAKEVLVFWRWTERLPGYRAFSEFAKTDPRVDLKVLKKKFGKIPSQPKEQNATWYKLFKKHEGKVSVLEANRSYLLYRDLTAITILSILISTFALFFTWNFWNQRIFFVVITAQFFLFKFAAKNAAERLVTNVLAEESGIS
jgi:hypothetical protein